MKTENKNSTTENINPFENLIKAYKEFSLLDTELYKNNIDAFSKFRENIFQNIMKHYEGYSNKMGEYADLVKYPFEHLFTYGDKGPCKCNSYFTKCQHCQSSDESEPTIEKDTHDIDNLSNTNNPNEYIPSSENESPDIDKSYDDSDSSYDDNDSSEKIDIFPASGHDICSLIAQNNNMSYLQIQAVLKIDGKLDLDKLNRAIRLSIDADPIFGCKFVRSDSPYWKRLENIDEIAFCELEETDDQDEAVKLFIQEPLDTNNSANIKAKIIRQKEYDILALKMNSACCDVTYAKEYLQLLSQIYTNINQNDINYKPESRIDSITNENILFKELARTYPELIWNPFLDIPKTMWAFPWRNTGRYDIRYAINRLPKGSLRLISQYGESRGAAVNDIILTALYRAMFKISKPMQDVPMDISSRIDLRRYLNDFRTQSVRNFSGEFITSIAKISDESFEDTLSRVVRATKETTQIDSPSWLMPNKSRLAGISSAICEEYIGKKCYSYFQNYFKHFSKDFNADRKYPSYVGNICFPEISNLGAISNTLIRFGDSNVSDAYMLPPAVRAPGFLLLTNSYNDILTMAIGYYKDSISHKDIENILNIIEKELMRICVSENI